MFDIIIMMCMITGGVIVFAATSALYLNQSVPPYAASLTSLSESVTQFPMSKSISHKLVCLYWLELSLSHKQVLSIVRSKNNCT